MANGKRGGLHNIEPDEGTSFYALVKKAMQMKKQCGTWATARWLDKQGIGVRLAAHILSGGSRDAR